MGKSIRSKRGKELRRIQREKLSHWDKKRIEKLSNALARSAEHVEYTAEDGTTKVLNDDQKQMIIDDLHAASEMATETNAASEETTEDDAPKSQNAIIKKGIPKRKKRKAAVYGKNKNSNRPKNRNIR